MSARELESLLGDKRSMRSRKVSERMAVVGEVRERAAPCYRSRIGESFWAIPPSARAAQNERRAAIEARLEALENDNAALDQFGADESDDEVGEGERAGRVLIALSYAGPRSAPAPRWPPQFAMTVDEDGNEIEAPGGKRKKGAARRSGVGTARRTRWVA